MVYQISQDTFFGVEIDVLPRPALMKCNIDSSDEESNDLDLQFTHRLWFTPSIKRYPFSVQKARYTMMENKEIETSRNAKYPKNENLSIVHSTYQLHCGTTVFLRSKAAANHIHDFEPSIHHIRKEYSVGTTMSRTD